MLDDINALVAVTPETFRQQRAIDARILHEVIAIDPARARVRVRNLQDEKEWWEPYDKLLIATGAIPIRPPLIGVDAEGVYLVHNLPDAITLRHALDQKRPKKGVIVGGGYIGVEMAEALLRRGLEVTIVERAPQLMLTLDPDMAELVAREMAEQGVNLYLGEGLAGFDLKNNSVLRVITDKRSIPADIVILAIGVRPNTSLAKEAGIPLGERGAIKVNERMRTETDRVWAAGDCAETFHLISRRPAYIPLATIANKQGRIAGIDIAGGSATFPGVVGTAVVKFSSLEIARSGLQEREIEGLGWEYVTAKVEGRTRAGYYPTSGKITVKLLAAKGSGRLLGGQIVGEEGAAKRIDIVATCLQAGFTVQEMVHLDLGYAPPFSPVWDPLLIAARQAARLL